MIDLQSHKDKNKYRIIKKPYLDLNDGQKTLILSKDELRDLAIMIIKELST